MKRSVAINIRCVKSMRNREAARRYDFSKADNEEIPIENMNGTQPALFVREMGKTQLFSVPALSAAGFHFFPCRYDPTVEAAGLSKAHTAPVDDDPRQVPYYTEHAT